MPHSPVNPARAAASALATVLVATLAACGGVGSGGDQGGERTGGAASLTTMGFGLPDEIAKVRVDAFKKANPGVALQINEGQFDEQAFLSAVAAATRRTSSTSAATGSAATRRAARSSRWTAASASRTSRPGTSTRPPSSR
nr:hypothetical protein GCM10020093_005170 [Planobispora longispora]